MDKLEIVRYIGGEYIPMRDLMVHESALRLQIPGVLTGTLYCSPGEQKELVVGHLYTQGLIRASDDILSLELDLEAGSARATLKETGRTAASKHRQMALSLIRRSCLPISSNFSISPPCRRPRPVPTAAPFAMTPAHISPVSTSAATMPWTS